METRFLSWEEGKYYYRLYIFETRRVIEIRNNSKLYKSIDSKIIEIVVKNT